MEILAFCPSCNKLCNIEESADENFKYFKCTSCSFEWKIPISDFNWLY